MDCKPHQDSVNNFKIVVKKTSPAKISGHKIKQNTMNVKLDK